MYRFETLPIVIFYEIFETQDLSLLNPDNKPIKEGELEALWKSIVQKYNERDNAQLGKRIFLLTKEIEILQSKYNLIQLCVHQLRFDKIPEVLEILKNLGYPISEQNYFEELDRVEKYSEGILLNIEQIQSQLPNNQTENTNSDTSIYDVLASYSTILGYNIGDFNKIVCPEFLALKKQVNSKIKHQEQELLKLKSKNKKNGR